MNKERGRSAHENSTRCIVQQGDRGSARGRGTELAAAKTRQISMADEALQRSRGGGRRVMAEPTSVDARGSARTRSWLRRRRMREDDEKSSDVV